MSIHQTFRGAAPVGYLNELSPLKLAAIVYFRMTCTSPEARAQLSKDFALAFGKVHGSIYEELIANFAQVLVQKSYRTIMRHDPDCKCFGDDENTIADMIVTAAGGDREKAQSLAVNLVPYEKANQLIGLAEEIGLALHLMLERFPAPVFSQSLSPTHNTNLN